MFTKTTRLGLVGAAAGMLTLMVPAAVQADDWTEVNSDDDSVEIGVGTEQVDPGSSGGDGDDSGDSTASGSADGPDDDGCEYTTVNPGLAPPGIGERPSPDHVLVARACRGEDVGFVGDFQWVEADEDGNLAIDPKVLAAQAVDNLRLPKPRISASPEAAQLVYLPVWLWLEGASWEVQSASASVPGLTVTATAVPVKATWDMGDANTVECQDAGTAWSKGMDPEAESPDCGHIYTRPSGDPLKTSVTVAWEVTWSGGGESGSVPGMTTTASVTWPVVESHALVTR